MKKKNYRVVIHFEGALSYDISANTLEEAQSIAEDIASKESSTKIDEAIAEFDICDAYEI